VVKAAEARDGYEDLESARPERREEYQPIAQFDHTYQQTGGVRDGGIEGPSYAEVVAGSSTQPKNAIGPSSDAPPSYSAIVKGGTYFCFAYEPTNSRSQSANLENRCCIRLYGC
jgi:hypothetical protein